jgi:flavin reductase
MVSREPLSDGQQDVSRWFADQHRPPGPAMFDDVPLEPGVTGSPILAGAAASFDCRLRQSNHAGDHLIMLGEVVTLIHHPELEPLIFHAGTYKSLAQESRRGRTDARRFGRDLGVPGQRPHRRAA